MRFWLGTPQGGSLVSAQDAMIPMSDHGFTVGDAVFETLKVVNGQPFALTRHLARLHRSAVGLSMTLPDEQVIRHAVGEIVAAAEKPVERLRITVSSGSGPLGSARGQAQWTLALMSGPATAWPATASIAVVPWAKYEGSAVTGLKTTSYAENVVALAYAQRLGADEGIFANTAGQLCEGTGSNVLIAMDGVLVTPTLASGALGGITRELAVQWCGVVERDVPIDALLRADEILLASSTRDLQPVSLVIERDGSQRILQAPGPLSQQAMAQFAAASADNIDP